MNAYTDTTYLGFDFGLKRIGVAIGQSLTGQARPLTVLRAAEGIPNWSDIENLINEWQINALVVGIPVHMDGRIQPIGQKALVFANSLSERFQLPVAHADERLSTMEARSKIFHQKGKKKRNPLAHGQAVDAHAAQIILQCWLDQQGE